jgi:hypothetical protein
MTHDDIIRLARESGWTEYSLLHAVEVQRLETFAALVAAAEREACALMAQAFGRNGYDFTGDLELHEAIRARGKRK